MSITPLPGRFRTGKPGSARGVSANLTLACAAELIGTFLPVLVSTAVATAAVQGKGTAGSAYRWQWACRSA